MVRVVSRIVEPSGSVGTPGWLRSTLVGGALFAAWGCAASSSWQPQSQFPSEAELASLLAVPLPGTAPDDAAPLNVEQWTMRGPLPTQSGDIALTTLSDAEQAVRETGTAAFIGEADRCVAQQFGEFYLEYGDGPPEYLERFMMLRCGSVATGVGWGVRSWTLSGSMTAEQAWTETVRSTVAGRIDELGLGATSRVGVWYGQRESTVAMMFVYSEAAATINPMSFDQAGTDTVRVEGTMLRNADRVRILTTLSELEYADCELDETVKLPAFAADCPVLSGDDIAAIKVVSFRRNRLLGPLVAHLAISPSGRAPTEWTYRGGAIQQRWANTSGTDDERFLAVVNQIRAESDRAPLEYLAAQSETNGVLAPYTFSDPSIAGSENRADTAYLGALAGYEVTRTLADSEAAMSSSPQGVSALEHWLLEAQFDPYARSVLFDPAADGLAVGVGVDGDWQYCLASSYVYFDDSLATAYNDGLVERVNRARERAGFDALPDAPGNVRRYIAAAATQIAEGEKSPRAALTSLSTKVVTAVGTTVWRNAQFVQTFEDIDIPEEFLERRAHGAMAVAPYRPEGSNWAWYVAMFVWW